MQHEFCCVNLIGRKLENMNNEPNNTHIRSIRALSFNDKMESSSSPFFPLPHNVSRYLWWWWWELPSLDPVGRETRPQEPSYICIKYLA
jgi:hypothetical protein